MAAMRIGRAAFALLLALAVVALDAAPAAAHGIGGAQPTNARTRVLSITPAVVGLHVEVVENGRRVEMRNDTRGDVVVSGYDGEPYLRIGPNGTYENRRSPAVYLNRTSTPPAHVPASYDAAAPPQWVKVSDASHARWHDHRAHPMAAGAFPTSRWSIPLSVDGRPVVVAGDMAWVEPGAWWPWLLLTLALALVVVLAAARSWRLVATLVLTALVFGEVLHLMGSWTDTSTSLAGRIGAQLISFTAIAIGAYALRRVSIGTPDASAPYALIAAVVFVVAGGVGDVASWFRSQLPSELAPDVVRFLVALALGAGAGLAIAAVRRLAPAARNERTGVTIPG